MRRLQLTIRPIIPPFLATLLLALASLASHGQVTIRRSPLPLQSPTVSRTEIAFVYAGSVWVMDRHGGEALRLTSEVGDESFPVFSPDGLHIAFSKSTGGGNVDIFVKSVAGGEARRLTYHPDVDLVAGWSPDGARVLFHSSRASNDIPYSRLFTIPARGGFETELPFLVAVQGSFSPHGDSIAYTPLRSKMGSWRHYRGGMTTPIKIAKLDTLDVEEIPRNNSNDAYPMWLQDKIFFLSDRDSTVNLFAYNPRTKKIDQLTQFTDYDIMSAGGGGAAIVFVRAGALHLYDLLTGKQQIVDVRISADFPDVKPRIVGAEGWIQSFSLSPSADRALFEARGEILTADVETGKTRNLTGSSGVAERSPVWSPDGKSIGYFSDESGEYQLHIRPASGEGAVRKILIEEHPSFYAGLVWSPDSSRVAFSDKRLTLWLVELTSGLARKIDISTFPLQLSFQPNWSPDGRWLAYSKNMPNRLATVFLYSLETKKSYPVTDTKLDAEFPVFDKNGQYLYFTGSTNSGPTKVANASMTAGLLFPPLVTRKVFVVVLQTGNPSPLIPLEERATRVREERPPNIDLEDISGRVFPLPVPPHNFLELLPGKPGFLFILGKWVNTVRPESRPQRTLYELDLATLKLQEFAENVQAADTSADRTTLILLQNSKFKVASTAAPIKEGSEIDLSGLTLSVEPQAEWRQIYEEVWRLERDYLYYPQLHGQNVAKLKQHYAAFLPNVVTRNDLKFLLQEVLSHLSISHMENGGGDVPATAAGGTPENTGMLGADFRVEENQYRITRLYRGDNSSVALRGPLTQPGVNVKEGDFLLAVDGEKIVASENLYKYFRGKTGKLVRLLVDSQPAGNSARTAVVVPMANDKRLRDYAMVERNRRLVDQKSRGTLAYIYLPNLNVEGFDIFNRDYYSQLDKQGLIIDERFNGGGYASDYMIEALKRAPLARYRFRDGAEIPFPADVLVGPRVMLISEYAGSAGDTLPWFFRKAGLGLLVGKRTRGFGIGNYVEMPSLIDGGYVRAPHRALSSFQKGIREIENVGVSPDIQVDWSPSAWRKGRDPQLERAIDVALRALRGTLRAHREK